MSSNGAAAQPDAVSVPILKGEPQDWFKVPVDAWESQKDIKWSKKTPASEPWAVIDASWLDHHGQLPHKHRRADVRAIAIRWGWTYRKTYEFLFDFLYALHFRDRHEYTAEVYRPVRSRVNP